MANVNGNSGLVKIGANTIAEVLDFSVDEAAATVDDTVLNDTSTTHKGGLLSWSGSVNCFYDTTDTNGQVAMAIGTSLTLILQPEGDTSGDATLTGLVTIVGIGRAVANDTIVTQSFTFTGNGALTLGTVT